MCGIAGVHIRDGSKCPRWIQEGMNDLTDELLHGIDHRGGDATGLAVYTFGGTFDLEKASVRAWTFEQHRRPLPLDARTVLLHTRYATHGLPTFPQNNHPIRRGAVALIHNGVIYNPGELFTQAETTPRGHVDSEALAATLDRFGFNNAQEALGKADGSYAVAALDVTTGAVLLARGNGSPLYTLVHAGFVAWASTGMAILDAFREAAPTGAKLPGWKDLRCEKEGTILRLDRGRVKRSTFKPYVPKWTKAITTTTKPKHRPWRKTKTTKTAAAPPAAKHDAALESIAALESMLAETAAAKTALAWTTPCDSCEEFADDLEEWEGLNVCGTCRTYFETSGAFVDDAD